MKILIAGDSFAADWSTKYNKYPGWPNLLKNDFSVKNVAQAGVSEYKILKQIELHYNDSYDFVIVSHTSPTRVHTRRHPVMHNDVLHNNADLLVNDIMSKRSWFNNALRAAQWYFKYHYDENYYNDVYWLIRDRIDNLLKNARVISICNFDEVYCNETFNFSRYRTSNPGLINHFDDAANALIHYQIRGYILNYEN